MPVPEQAAYSVFAKTVAHTALRDWIDTGNSTPYAAIEIYDAEENFLTKIPLDLPCGAIDPETGRLTLIQSTQTTRQADSSGTAARAVLATRYLQICLSIPVKQGTEQSAGFFVLSSIEISAGDEVSLVSAVIG